TRAVPAACSLAGTLRERLIRPARTTDHPSGDAILTRPPRQSSAAAARPATAVSGQPPSPPMAAVMFRDTYGAAQFRRYLKSVFGCLPCSFTDLSSCVEEALS